MKKFMILILLMSSIMAVHIQSYSQENNERKISELSNKLISFIRAGDFETASELFHYPATLSQEDLLKKKQTLTKKLRAVDKEFGGLARFRSGDTSQNIIGVGISGAEITYWKESKKNFRQIIFPVEFKNEGPGFLKIGFCDIDNLIQIQGVEFALPPSKQAKDRISEINKKIAQKGKEDN